MSFYFYFSAVTEEQSLRGAAAGLRSRRGGVRLLHHAAGAGPVCAGIHQRKSTQSQISPKLTTTYEELANSADSVIKLAYKCERLPSGCCNMELGISRI